VNKLGKITTFIFRGVNCHLELFSQYWHRFTVCLDSIQVSTDPQRQLSRGDYRLLRRSGSQHFFDEALKSKVEYLPADVSVVRGDW